MDEEFWIYEQRTNKRFTLKTNLLTREDLDEFVECYNPSNRHDRTCGPYLTLLTPEASQLHHSLREVFNALRWLVRAGVCCSMIPRLGRPFTSRPSAGLRRANSK